MRKRILIISLVITLIGMVVFSIVSADIYYRNSLNATEAHLKVYMNFYDSSVSPDAEGASLLSQRMGGARVTFMRLDGSVLADSSINEELLPHGDREEVAEALKNGEGFAVRISASLGENLMYYCRRCDDILVRIAVPTSSAWGIFGRALPTIVWFLALDVLACLLFTYLATEFIIKPVEKMTRQAALIGAKPIETEFKELQPLADIMNEMNGRIESKIGQIEEDARLNKLLLNSMEHGIAIIDKNGAVLLINDAAAKLLDYREDTGEAEGLKAEQLCALTASGEPQLVYKNYGKREYALRYTLAGDFGVLLMTDVTEIRRAERSKNEFIDNVTHEMNTPLTSIKGFAELLNAGKLSGAKQQEACSIIIRQSDKLSRLIRSIIDYSEIDNDELPVYDVDASELIKETLQNFEPKFAEKKLRIVTEIEDGIIVASRRERLAEIVGNLVSNAIRYNRENGEISVSFKADKKLIVADKGIGIDKEQLTRIFDRFYTVDKSHGGEGGGFGLGLAIVKKICNRFGWKLAVTSVKGEGSVFSVDFNN